MPEYYILLKIDTNRKTPAIVEQWIKDKIHIPTSVKFVHAWSVPIEEGLSVTTNAAIQPVCQQCGTTKGVEMATETEGGRGDGLYGKTREVELGYFCKPCFGVMLTSDDIMTSQIVDEQATAQNCPCDQSKDYACIDHSYPCCTMRPEWNRGHATNCHTRRMSDIGGEADA
jgi:hypothetical protein